METINSPEPLKALGPIKSEVRSGIFLFLR
jgi:hypothetical protein